MRLIALIGFALAVAMNLAFAFSTPQRDGWITDQAGIVDADTASAITTRLVALQRDTGAEVVVVTLSSLQDASIETWGNLLGENWGVGRSSGNDTGVLLIVAPNDRKVRIAVGYGLGNRIPDSVAAAIIADHIIPYFKRGEFARGVKAGIDSIAVQLDRNAGARATDVERGITAYPVSAQPPGLGARIVHALTPSKQTRWIIFWILVGLVVLYIMYRNAGNVGFFYDAYDNDSWSSFGWSSSSGDSSSSGGGGGGSFGGGATGSW